MQDDGRLGIHLCLGLALNFSVFYYYDILSICKPDSLFAKIEAMSLSCVLYKSCSCKSTTQFIPACMVHGVILNYTVYRLTFTNSSTTSNSSHYYLQGSPIVLTVAWLFCRNNFSYGTQVDVIMQNENQNGKQTLQESYRYYGDCKLNKNRKMIKMIKYSI